MKTLYDTIKENLELHASKSKRHFDELHGYWDTYPQYRVTKRELCVNYIDEAGKYVKDAIITRPRDFPENRNFDNLVTLVWLTGLKDIPKQLVDIRVEPFIHNMPNIVNELCSNKIRVLSGELRLTDDMVDQMYMDIASAFDIDTSK